MKNKVMSFMLAAALLLAFAVPASAEQSAEQSLDIRLKVGSAQMIRNGSDVKITAPYSANGTTMLPMSVFTKGLGAKLSLKNNKVITLTAPKHTVVVTFGSKSATADGKKVTLSAAPVMKNNIAFAPLQLVGQLGAKVTTDAAGKQIRITSDAAGTVKPDGSVIDTDSGKSKIGDSYYQWSMSYPTGLIQDYQSEDGDYLLFQDVKQEYSLTVSAEKAGDTLTTEEKRAWMAENLETGETVLDRRTVTGAGKSYEKMITKNTDGFLFEVHGMQANGYFYMLSFGKKAANVSELAPYTAVLDSFKPSFDPSDRTLKDLTKIKDGLKSFKSENYGLTVSLPKEWKANERDYSYPYYESKNGFLFTEVYSVTSGDTLEAWIKRDAGRFRDTYLEAYRKIEDAKPVEWNGKPATLVKISYSNDTKTWWHNYQVYAIQGQYRYFTVLGMAGEKEEDKSAAMFDSVMKSLKIDFTVIDKTFGTLTDDSDTADLTATSTKTSREFGYSVTLPNHWTGTEKDFESDDVVYEFPGGKLEISVLENVKDSGIPDMMKLIDDSLKERVESDSNVKVLSSAAVTFAGQSAKKYVIEDKSNEDMLPNVETVYFIEHNGNMYAIEGWYYLANATESVMKPLEAAMNSFTFTK